MIAVSPDVKRVCALTPLQEGLLVESLAAPATGLYLEQIVAELPNGLSMSAISDAWRAVVARHDVLRSSFHWRDLDRPLQVVHRQAPVSVSHQDLRRLPPARRADAARWFLDHDKSEGFNFERAPLLRVAVLRYGAARHQLVVTLHHILLDGWSLGIVMADLERLYQGFAQGTPVRLDEPPSFADYVAWLEVQEPEAAERYWRRELRGYRALSSIARRVGSHGSSPDHREFELAITSAETQAARARASSERVTPNTIVLGAWMLALAAELQTDDLVVGTVVSGREAPVARMDEIVGLCMNTVPVRMRLPAQQSADVWLAQLHAKQLKQREYQYCALTSVHGWSEMPRGRPLFESIFIFENHARSTGRGQAWAFERTSYPLSVIVGVGGELAVRILYDASLIDSEAVQRLAGRLRSALAQLARDARRPLGELGDPTQAETGALPVSEEGAGAGTRPVWVTS